MSEHSLVVAARFNGPPGSGNGGYVAGLLAESAARLLPAYRLGDPLQITLREPPPLETPLRIAVGDEGAQVVATFGGAVVATAEAGSLRAERGDPVSFEEAAEAEQRYAGLRAHPFPSCFVCGPDRPAGDGMALRPGRVRARPTHPDSGTGTGGTPASGADRTPGSGADRTPGSGADPGGEAAPVATTWVPDASLAGADGLVAEPFVWAALDCPGGWASDLEARPLVLGRLTAAVQARPEVGDRCVVVGRLLGVEGRKAYSSTTAYDEDGRVLGQADATWITLR